MVFVRDKTKILNSREAVDAYRTAHTALYAVDPHRRSIPEEHTPLLAVMREALQEQGFWYLQDFFNASEALNLQELGLEGKELTKSDREALDGMWR